MVKNHQSGGSVMAGGNISIVLQPCGTSLALSALIWFFEGNVRCDDGEEQEERRIDCSLFWFVADEGKQVLSNSDAAAACVHAFQEAMLLVFTCVHLLVFTCLCSKRPCETAPPSGHRQSNRFDVINL